MTVYGLDDASPNNSRRVDDSEQDALDGEGTSNDEEVDDQPHSDYTISRTPGQGYQTGQFIHMSHRAPGFASALKDFLVLQAPSRSITHATILSATYGIYKQFTRVLPEQHPTVRMEPFIDCVRACPATPKRAEYFDTVLICMREDPAEASALSLHDCRVGQPIPTSPTLNSSPHSRSTQSRIATSTASRAHMSLKSGKVS
ncbi:hypothetical protein BC628DRAFT_515210 [Trametes gibbosa]|nr:hypothetical protein BC628DRAFT_515210 [Trametes gibbosa]